MNIPNRTHHFRFLLLQAAAIGLLAASSVHAATYTWDGGGANANWGTADNWDATPTFNNQADIIFNASGAAQLSNFLGAARTIRSLTFNADSDSNVTIRTTTTATGTTAANLTFDTDAVGGNATITVDAGSAGNHNVGVAGGNIALSDNLVITHNGSGTLTLSSPVTGAFNITKDGTGTLALSSANTYNGTTTVNAGTLNLTGNRTAEAGPITVQTGGTLGVSDGTFSLGLAGTEVFQVGLGSGTSTVNHTSGTISTGAGGNQMFMGVGGIYNLSGGELNIGYTGATTGGRGILVGTNVNATATFNLSGTGHLNMAGSTSGLNIGFNSNGVTSLFNQTSGTATIQYLRIGGNTGTGVNSTLSITGGVFTAATFDRLASAATNTALIAIGGTADVTLPAFPTAALGAGSTATITFDGGVLKNLAASTNYLGSISSAQIKTGGAKFITTGGDITITQAMANFSGHTGSLTKEGGNTLTLSGGNTYTGATTISAGTLALSAAGSIAGSSLIDVASGGVFDVALVSGGFSVASGQSLGGAGSILGDLVFGSGSKLVFSTTDTLALSGGTASFFAGTPGSRFGIDDLLGISSSTPTGTYTLISGTVDTANLDNLGSGNAYNLGAGVSAYFQQGSLQVVVVPEPSAVALVGIGLAGVAWAVTRRRRSRAA